MAAAGAAVGAAEGRCGRRSRREEGSSTTCCLESAPLNGDSGRPLLHTGGGTRASVGRLWGVCGGGGAPPALESLSVSHNFLLSLSLSWPFGKAGRQVGSHSQVGYRRAPR